MTRVPPDAAAHDGPLAGMAFTVKDALAVAGVRATAGSRVLEYNVATSTAPVVAALRRAGATVVGKTNCSEFALAPIPRSELFGVTVNPRDASLTAGGSSCGCAAAVAAGLVPFSVGSDYGGSVRYPAACVGIVGFRPAIGSVDAGGQIPVPPPGSPRARFSVPGLLCRDLDVLEMLLRVLVPEEFAAGAAADPVEPAEMNGATIAEADRLFSQIRATDDVADLRALAHGREDLLTEPTRALLRRTPSALPRDHHDALRTLCDRIPAAVTVLPVTTTPLQRPLDQCDADPQHVDALFRDLAPCRAITLLGWHAIAVEGRQVAAPRGMLAAALRAARGLA